MNRAAEIFRSLEPRAQIALAGSALAVAATLIMLYSYASKPSYVTLASNLPAAEGGAIAKALEGAGVTYELRDGGTTVAVKAGQESRARVTLAGEGLGTGGPLGYELFDKKSGLGTTDFEQKVQYQRALEGEIARTILAVDGVQGAEVQLVLPRESLFLDEGAKASAAVLLRGGAGLDGNAVSGIARLVASSVEGLDAKDVTITDDGGSLLWPSGLGGGDSATAKLEAEQRYANQLSAQIDSMLSATLGPGRAMARVHASLDLDRRTVDSVTYGKRGVPLSSTEDTEILGGKGGAGANGVAGVASNLPGYSAGSKAATSAAAKGATYTRTQGTTEYGVDKRVETTTVVPGAVNKIDVALIVDKAVPAAQVTELEKSVAGLAGIDTERGDTISVARVEFAKVKEKAPVAPAMLDQLGGPLGAGKFVLLGLGVIVFLFMVRRGLKRRESEALGPEPTWLREITEARSLRELEATQVMGPRQLDPVAAQRQNVTQQVEEIARRQPEQIAQQVSQWMQH